MAKKRLLLKRDLDLNEVLKAISDYAINTSQSPRMRNAHKHKTKYVSNILLHMQVDGSDNPLKGAIVEVYEDGEEEEKGNNGGP